MRTNYWEVVIVLLMLIKLNFGNPLTDPGIPIHLDGGEFISISQTNFGTLYKLFLAGIFQNNALDF